MKAPVDYSRFVSVDQLPQIEFSTSTGLPSAPVQSRIATQLHQLINDLWESRNAMQRQGGNYVYVGMAGLALTLMALGDLMLDHEKSSEPLRRVASQWTPEQCFSSALSCAQLPSTHSDKHKDNRLTFLEGKMGVLAIQIVCHHRLTKLSADATQHRNEVWNVGRALVSLAEDAIANTSALENELLYGRSGVLFALHFVNSVEGLGEALGLRDLMVKLVAQIIESGVNHARDFRKNAADDVFDGSGVAFGFPAMYEWHGKEYLGAAHGYCGIIQVLLNVKEYWGLAESQLQIVEGTIRALVTCVLQTILLESRYASGNVAPSLPMQGKSDRLVHWCHGAPGFMFTLASFLGQDRLTMKSKHIVNSAAQEMGAMIRERGCLPKLGLCHGLGGNGMALIRAYQITDNQKFIRRATQYALYGFEHRQTLADKADRPLSLFEGIAGLAFLHMALLAPHSVGFPGYDRVGTEVKPPVLRKVPTSGELEQQSMSEL